MFAPDWLSLASSGVLTTLTGNPGAPITIRVRQQRLQLATRSNHLKLKLATRHIRLVFRINHTPQL